MNAKTFFGVALGAGSAAGMLVKTYLTFADDTPAFWWWAAGGVVMFFAIVLLVSGARERASVRARVERASRAGDLRARRREAEGLEDRTQV
jgi:hypothetical protein